MAPTVGHEIVLYHPLSPKMFSTRIRAGVNKQVEAGPSGPANITLDLVAILDGQAKMQQELADLKKRSADEMEALRPENSRLRRKIEADPTQKGKAKETFEVARSPAFQHTEEESEYNPTPHTFTTTQQTPILSAHPTHFHSTLLTVAPTPAATLLTTHVPYNMPTTLHTTHIPPYNPHNLPTTHILLTTSPPLFPPSSTIPYLLTHFHPTYPNIVTLSPTSSPTPAFSPSGNPSHWSVTLVKPTPTNTSKSTSPTSHFTLPMTQSFAKPFLPPPKAPPSNGSRPSHHTLSTTTTPSHTCLPLISLAAARTKLLQYHSSASGKNKARRFWHLSIASARLPFAPHTSIKR